MAVAQSTSIPLPQQEGVEFREIPDFPGYCVGDDGSVWTRKNTHGQLGSVWKRRKPYRNAGYPAVRLCIKGKCTFRLVHVLVMTLFVGERPEGMEVCHQNGDPTDARLVNLRWDTHSGNTEDARRHGTMYMGSRHHLARLTEDGVREIRRRFAAGESCKKLAHDNGVSRTTIERIVKRIMWRHLQ